MQEIENQTVVGKPDDHYNTENEVVGACRSCGNVLHKGDLWYKDLNDEYYCDFICYGSVEVRRGHLIDSEDE